MSSQIIELLKDIVSVISDVLPLIMFIFGLATQKLYKKHRAHLLNKVLSLKKSPLEVVVGTRYGHITHNENKTSPNEEYITYKASAVLVEIYKMADTIFSKKLDDETPLVYSNDNHIQNERNNAFIIGGFLANSYVQNLFLERFTNIKFSCSEETYEKYEKLRPILEFDPEYSTSKRRICVNDKELFSYDRHNEGYLVLIKLTGKADFKNSDHGTHHICFGNTASNTLQAVCCYNDFRNEIYKRLKKRKEHYFVIIKCKRGGQLDFLNFYDLSDEVFSPPAC